MHAKWTKAALLWFALLYGWAIEEVTSHSHTHTVPCSKKINQWNQSRWWSKEPIDSIEHASSIHHAWSSLTWRSLSCRLLTDGPCFPWPRNIPLSLLLQIFSKSLFQARQPPAASLQIEWKKGALHLKRRVISIIHVCSSIPHTLHASSPNLTCTYLISNSLHARSLSCQH